MAGDRLAQEGEGDDGDGGGGEDGGDLVGDLVVLLHDVVHALSLDLLYPSRVGDGEMLITTVPIVWAVIEDAVVAVWVTGLEIPRHGKGTIMSTGGDPPRGSWSGVRWRPRSDGTRRARPGESRCGPCGWWASRRRERRSWRRSWRPFFRFEGLDGTKSGSSAGCGCTNARRRGSATA